MCYFERLGVNNIRLFKEAFTELSDKGHLFDTVTAILACPPSTNSSLHNPVDFAIARGGEIQLLYSLAKESENIRVEQYLLDEQRKTLIKAMAKPQVSHSKNILYRQFFSYTFI